MKEVKKRAKKIAVVTGGAGFVGSHLCERLVKTGSRVIALDNYSSGRKENHVRGVEYIEGDTAQIAAHISVKPDIVFHLGEYARVEQSFGDMERVWKSNKIGTFAVLEFCRQKGAKIVYAGSSTKFGDGGMGRDQSPYAWTKASNTELVQNYGSWFGVPYAITYFYNVYGPREIGDGQYATVVAIFKNKFLRGEAIPVRMPGTQRRIFTHVNDIVDGLVLVGEKGEGDGYGLGAERDFSILELAHMFGMPITTLPERAGNRMSASLETAKSKALGWTPKYDLEKHIREFIADSGATKLSAAKSHIAVKHK